MEKNKEILKIANYIFGNVLENDKFTKQQFEMIEIIENSDLNGNVIEIYKDIYSNREQPNKVKEIVENVKVKTTIQNNNLMIFENEKFGKIRTIIINDEPWFVAVDVCKILEIKNTTQAINRLDNDERTMFNIGRQGNTNIINEYGLYTLILASRKQEARQFKRWITHDVIPEIRKKGSYNANMKESDEEVITKAVKILNRKVEQAHKQIDERKDIITNIMYEILNY